MMVPDRRGHLGGTQALANHSVQARFGHQARSVSVHPVAGGRARRANDIPGTSGSRADIIDDLIAQLTGKRLSRIKQLNQPLVGGVPVRCRWCR